MAVDRRRLLEFYLSRVSQELVITQLLQVFTLLTPAQRSTVSNTIRQEVLSILEEDNTEIDQAILDVTNSEDI
jgi:hypothetical protein